MRYSIESKRVLSIPVPPRKKNINGLAHSLFFLCVVCYRHSPTLESFSFQISGSMTFLGSVNISSTGGPKKDGNVSKL